jgi:hypothetical protein
MITMKFAIIKYICSINSLCKNRHFFVKKKRKKKKEKGIDTFKIIHV